VTGREIGQEAVVVALSSYSRLWIPHERRQEAAMDSDPWRRSAGAKEMENGVVEPDEAEEEREID